MYKTLELTLDTERTNNTKTNAQNFLVNTNDYESVKIIADIVQDKERVDLSDATVKLAIRKPDQTIVFQDGTVTAAIEGECEFVLETQSYVLKGTHVAEVMIYFADGKIVVTRAFAYHVAEGILSDAAIESTSWYQDVNELQLAVQELQVEVDAFIATAVEETRAEITEVDTRLTSQLADKVTNLTSLSPTGETRYLGHRGMSRLAPEGTQAAFELVAEYGVWGCEFDIQLTSDGAWVVIHDLTVDTLTNGTGAVNTLTLSQIKALTVDHGTNVTKYPNQKILTVEEAVVLCRRLNIMPCMEIKAAYTGAQLDNLISILRKNGVEERCLIEGNRAICDDVRIRSKKIGLMLFATNDDLTYIPKLGNAMAATLHTNVADKGFIDYMHGLGVPVCVFTVNDVARARTLEKMGVDFIMTDSLIGGAY